MFNINVYIFKDNISGTAMDFDQKIAILDKSKADLRLGASIQGDITIYSYAKKRDGYYVDQDPEIVEE